MNESGVTIERQLVLRRLNDGFPFASPEAGAYCWWVLVILLLLVGGAFVVWKYARDAGTCSGGKAFLLGGLRYTVYLLLAFAFLLPARQVWETREKRSHVIILIDVSRSVSDRGNDSAGARTRLDQILDCLTDDQIAMMKKLTAKNEVFVYRFGSKLDDEPQSFKADSPAWNAEDWRAWARYDFKPWILRGLSAADREAITSREGWRGEEPGTASWAKAWLLLPNADVAPTRSTTNAEGKPVIEYELENAQAFTNAREKLSARVDMARSVVEGTSLPDSMVAALNRESSNMVQALIVFSDGRSNPGIDTTFEKLKRRSGDKVPVFTIVVGEARENASISITDVQVPTRASPDEAFKIIVEADGQGLEGKTVDVKLDLYLPKKDPKTSAPDITIPAKLTFEGNDPPHGRVEVKIDPDKMPDALKEEVLRDKVKKKVLKIGTWSVVARIAKDPAEAYANAEHVSPPKPVNVVDTPLRILLWASGPSREYQTLRTLLMREVDAQRAEVSILLQNEGGASGDIAQDIDAKRMLKMFPLRNDVRGGGKPEEKYYNLNEYDLIIAFDPDWRDLSKEQIEMLANWVRNGGGGFIFVAGSIHTHQLARKDDQGIMKSILEILPVIPEDRIVMTARRIPRTPRRLKLNPDRDFDVLRLDDSGPDDKSTDSLTAGWEMFFTGQQKHVEPTPENPLAGLKDLTPPRGFYSFYPVKAKDGKLKLAEFMDMDENNKAVLKPYLVAAPENRGFVAFLASGEMYRIRYPEVGYYERFWIRLARAMTANRRNVQSFRGEVLVSKEYAAGAMIRVNVRILDASTKPYASGEIAPKFRVEQLEGKTKVNEFGPFPLEERRPGKDFDGYYQAQMLADAAQFPAGEFTYKIIVDLPNAPGETPLSGEFKIKKANPEMDNLRPDPAAMSEAASALEEVKGAIRDAKALEVLRGAKPETADAENKLAFSLEPADRARLALIPDCIDGKELTLRNRGPVDDLWDRGVNLGDIGGDSNRPVKLSYLLFLAVGLLSAEWIIRKVVRLA